MQTLSNTQTLSYHFLNNSTFNSETSKQYIVDTYKLARWFYKIGSPILDDKEYDSLHSEFLKYEVFNSLTGQHYEDDPLPRQSFEVFNINPHEFQLEENRYQLNQNTSRLKRWESELQDEESKSIYPIESMYEAYKWFQENGHMDVIISLKVDGINTKNLYTVKDLTATHQVSATRSRKDSGIDITDNMAKVIPTKLNLDAQHDGSLFVRGEAYVPSKSLAYLRDKYKQPYKIPRSTAMSAIRKGFNDEDMHHLRLLVFKTGIGETVEEGYLTAQQLGFNTAPYELHSNAPISGFATFEIWLTEIMNRMWSLSKELDIPTDGLVVQVNDLNEFKKKGSFGNYNYGAIALKFGQWSSDVYESKVVDIKIIPRKEEYSYVAIIEPTVVKSGVEVERVNLFNANIMIKTNVNIGSTIRFEYKSESSVNLIY